MKTLSTLLLFQLFSHTQGFVCDSLSKLYEEKFGCCVKAASASVDLIPTCLEVSSTGSNLFYTKFNSNQVYTEGKPAFSLADFSSRTGIMPMWKNVNSVEPWYPFPIFDTAGNKIGFPLDYGLTQEDLEMVADATIRGYGNFLPERTRNAAVEALVYSWGWMTIPTVTVDANFYMFIQENPQNFYGGSIVHTVGHIMTVEEMRVLLTKTVEQYGRWLPSPDEQGALMALVEFWGWLVPLPKVESMKVVEYFPAPKVVFVEDVCEPTVQMTSSFDGKLVVELGNCFGFGEERSDFLLTRLDRDVHDFLDEYLETTFSEASSKPLKIATSNAFSGEPMRGLDNMNAQEMMGPKVSDILGEQFHFSVESATDVFPADTSAQNFWNSMSIAELDGKKYLFIAARDTPWFFPYVVGSDCGVYKIDLETMKLVEHFQGMYVGLEYVKANARYAPVVVDGFVYVTNWQLNVYNQAHLFKIDAKNFSNAEALDVGDLMDFKKVFSTTGLNGIMGTAKLADDETCGDGTRLYLGTSTFNYHEGFSETRDYRSIGLPGTVYERGKILCLCSNDLSKSCSVTENEYGPDKPYWEQGAPYIDNKLFSSTCPFEGIWKNSNTSFQKRFLCETTETMKVLEYVPGRVDMVVQRLKNRDLFCTSSESTPFVRAVNWCLSERLQDGVILPSDLTRDIRELEPIGFPSGDEWLEPVNETHFPYLYHYSLLPYNDVCETYDLTGTVLEPLCLKTETTMIDPNDMVPILEALKERVPGLNTTTDEEVLSWANQNVFDSKPGIYMFVEEESSENCNGGKEYIGLYYSNDDGNVRYKSSCTDNSTVYDVEVLKTSDVLERVGVTLPSMFNEERSKHTVAVGSLPTCEDYTQIPASDLVPFEMVLPRLDVGLKLNQVLKGKNSNGEPLALKVTKTLCEDFNGTYSGYKWAASQEFCGWFELPCFEMGHLLSVEEFDAWIAATPWGVFPYSSYTQFGWVVPFERVVGECDLVAVSYYMGHWNTMDDVQELTVDDKKVVVHADGIEMKLAIGALKDVVYSTANKQLTTAIYSDVISVKIHSFNDKIDLTPITLNFNITTGNETFHTTNPTFGELCAFAEQFKNVQSTRLVWGSYIPYHDYSGVTIHKKYRVNELVPWTAYNSLYSSGAGHWTPFSTNANSGTLYVPSSNAHLHSVDRYYITKDVLEYQIALRDEESQTALQGDPELTKANIEKKRIALEMYEESRKFLSPMDAALNEDSAMVFDITKDGFKPRYFLPIEGADQWSRYNGIDKTIDYYVDKEQSRVLGFQSYLDVDANYVVEKDGKLICNSKGGTLLVAREKDGKLEQVHRYAGGTSVGGLASGNYGGTCTVSNGEKTMVVISGTTRAPSYGRNEGWTSTSGGFAEGRLGLLTGYNINEAKEEWWIPMFKNAGGGITCVDKYLFAMCPDKRQTCVYDIFDQGKIVQRLPGFGVDIGNGYQYSVSGVSDGTNNVYMWYGLDKVQKITYKGGEAPPLDIGEVVPGDLCNEPVQAHPALEGKGTRTILDYTPYSTELEVDDSKCYSMGEVEGDGYITFTISYKQTVFLSTCSPEPTLAGDTDLLVYRDVDGTCETAEQVACNGDLPLHRTCSDDWPSFAAFNAEPGKYVARIGSYGGPMKTVALHIDDVSVMSKHDIAMTLVEETEIIKAPVLKTETKELNDFRMEGPCQPMQNDDGYCSAGEFIFYDMELRNSRTSGSVGDKCYVPIQAIYVRPGVEVGWGMCKDIVLELTDAEGKPVEDFTTLSHEYISTHLTRWYAPVYLRDKDKILILYTPEDLNKILDHPLDGSGEVWTSGRVTVEKTFEPEPTHTETLESLKEKAAQDPCACNTELNDCRVINQEGEMEFEPYCSDSEKGFAWYIHYGEGDKDVCVLLDQRQSNTCEKTILGSTTRYYYIEESRRLQEASAKNTKKARLEHLYGQGKRELMGEDKTQIALMEKIYSKKIKRM